MNDILKLIEMELPTATDIVKAIKDAEYRGYMKAVEDRPQGEWIYGEHNVAMCDGYRCNRCDFFVPWYYEHKFIDFINDYHFCPNCGAQMKGADDEDNSTNCNRRD